jgi:hypothetical protein
MRVPRNASRRRTTGLIPPGFQIAAQAGPYRSDELIESNLPLNVEPSPFTAAMMVSAIPAAIKPYSIAVAPESSRKNITTIAFIVSASFFPFSEPNGCNAGAGEI